MCYLQNKKQIRFNHVLLEDFDMKFPQLPYETHFPLFG